MLRGFYTAASGMIAQQRRQESLANNIANQNTPGFKEDQTTLRAFPELLMQQMGSTKIPTTSGANLPRRNTLGSLNTGVYVQETLPNFIQGDLRETGTTTDLAIVNGMTPDENGSVFFTVQNEEGELRYTRNGNFTIDGQGALVTSQGYYVLDNNGNQIQTNGLEFHVTTDGSLNIDGQNIQLGLAYVDNTHDLTKEGNDLFNGEANAIPAGVTYMVQQGFLEGSNVNAIQAMTEMMESYRMFETNQKVLKAYDESLGKAVNEIGRLG